MSHARQTLDYGSRRGSASVFSQSAKVAATQPVPAHVLRSGTLLPIRFDQTISSKTARPGDVIDASLAVDLVENGSRVLPAGTPVTLRVTDVQHGGYNGSQPLLAVEAVCITIQYSNSTRPVPILTNTVTRTGNQVVHQNYASTTASIFSSLTGHYPGTYYGLGQTNRYAEVRFIAGDTIRLSLSEEVLLP